MSAWTVPDRPMGKWDRVKAVKEGAQCLYSQRYGTIMSDMGDGWFEVLLDDFAGTYYQRDQLVFAEPQTEACTDTPESGLTDSSAHAPQETIT